MTFDFADPKFDTIEIFCDFYSWLRSATKMPIEGDSRHFSASNISTWLFLHPDRDAIVKECDYIDTILLIWELAGFIHPESGNLFNARSLMWYVFTEQGIDLYDNIRPLKS